MIDKKEIRIKFPSLNSLKNFIKEVKLFPLYYILTIYLSFYILPFEIWDKKTFYHLWSYEEYLAEHFQFILYFLASLFSFLNILRNKYKVFGIQNLFWMFFCILTFIISIEEISFLDLLKDSSFEFLREFNTSREINLHNSSLIGPNINYIYILVNLFLGFFGWKFFSVIEAIPQKKYSLFFLFCSLAYIFLELGEIIPLIPFIHQEIFEFLMSLGLFLNTFERFIKYSKS